MKRDPEFARHSATQDYERRLRESRDRGDRTIRLGESHREVDPSKLSEQKLRDLAREAADKTLERAAIVDSRSR